jgi:hypothetical protein
MSAPDPGAKVGHAAGAGASHVPPAQTRLRQLVDEQAALRRVATLVAGGSRAQWTDRSRRTMPTEFDAEALRDAEIGGEPGGERELRRRRIPARSPH